jgi:hypothetical protein
MRIGVFGLPIITRSLVVESLFDASSQLIGRTLISSTALLPQSPESKVVSFRGISVQRFAKMPPAYTINGSGIHKLATYGVES